MLCQFRVYKKVSQLSICIYLLFFQILFPYKSLQSIEKSSLCYTIGPCVCVCVCVYVSHSVMFDSLRHCGLQPARLLCPWEYPGKNTGRGFHFLLQGILPTQGSNLSLLHCRQVLLPSEPPGKPTIDPYQTFILYMSDSHSVVSDSLQPHGLETARILCLWNSPGKNTGNISPKIPEKEISFPSPGDLLHPEYLYIIYILYIVVCICGEGNGTPLQYSCLENPVDGGA